MQKISMRKPENEPIGNIRQTDAEWNLFSTAMGRVPLRLEIPMIIGGKKVYSDKKSQNINPSNLEVIGTYQEGNDSHGAQAAAAALEARKHWSSLSPATRIQKIRDVEYVLEKWKFETCATAALECGYAANETAGSWAEMMDFVRFNSHYYTDILGEQLGDGIYETNSLQMRPLKGFTCAVTPFNFPIAIGFNLPLAMALTGNTVVWKPSSDAVLTSYMLMLALEECGFPPGVINFLTGEGPECLPSVLTHPELSCVNFTGSFNTARIFGNYLYGQEYKRANFPRFVAETGGKDFLVADKDIDVKDTATQIVQGAFGRSGQKCSANSVVFVHQDIWPSLKTELVKQTAALKVCDPRERTCDFGPVINERAFNKITAAIEKAKKDPACKIIAGGGFDKSKGFYIDATLIEVNAAKHELLTEEIFGPVTAIKTYSTLEEAEGYIRLHNYRLTGSVISRNEKFLEEAVPVLSELAGNFYVNRRTTGAIVDQQPFGGDGASGTNAKPGGRWYLLNFISQGAVTRRHSRTTTPTAFEALQKK